MQRTVQELAELVQGRVHGDGARVIETATALDRATSGSVSFVQSESYLAKLPACTASAVVVPIALIDKHALLLDQVPATLSLIIVDDAVTAFVTLARHLRGEVADVPTGIDPRAIVHPTAVVGPDASIHALAVVGEGAVIGARCRIWSGAVVGRRCQLGDDVTLHPQAVLYDGCILGHRVIVHAHAVLGADGFGYRLQNGRHVKMPQLGHVEVGDDVEIGAGTTIDRGTFEPTRIGMGTKIDNLVQIGHNCQIGPHNIFAGQTGFGGSCTTGSHVTTAGQAGLADHLHLGDRAMVAAKSGVSHDVPADARVFGTPAKPLAEIMRILHGMNRLPDLLRDVRVIKQQLGLDRPEKAAG